MTELAITYLSPGRFAAAPQVGLTVSQEWHSLLRWLTWPTFADAKQAAGAWCPCALVDGAVKAGRGPVSLLVADVDDCTAGALERAEQVLRPHRGAIIPTFSATPEKPKHRIVLLPSRQLTAEEFPIAWPKMARALAAGGIVVDRGCKNLNRLYFACVARSPAHWLGARLLTGDPVDVDAMLATAREEAEEERTQRAAQARRTVSPEHRDRYVAGALEKARGNVAGAPEGGRHEALLREAYSLARLDLSDRQITEVLLEAFVGAAGEHRRREGEHAIRDAVSARARGTG